MSEQQNASHQSGFSFHSSDITKEEEENGTDANRTNQLLILVFIYSFRLFPLCIESIDFITHRHQASQARHESMLYSAMLFTQ